MLVTRLILFLLLLAIIPTALLADPSFFWENYPVEMSQNIVLTLATILAFYWAYKEKVNRGVWFTGAMLFLIAMFRELSWSRVLFVKRIGLDGPVIAKKSELWFGPYLSVFVGILLLILLISIIYNRKYLLQLAKTFKSDTQSLCYGLLMVILLAAASLLFDRNVITALSTWHQGLEEMTELTAYWTALTLAIRLHYLVNKKQ